MKGERTVGIERERRAFEDEFVLAADLIEIDERQAAFDDARDGDVLTNRELVALVRGGVGNEQDFAARLGDAFDRIGAPDVFADRHADAHAAKHDRPRRGTRLEHPLFVEHAVIGQIDLEAHRLDPPAVEQRRGVVQRAVLDPRQSDEHGRPAVGGLAREALAGGAAGLLERRLEHQILGRISGEIELGRHHQIRAEARGLGARPAQTLEVALDVADDRRDLREGDDEAIGGSGHGRRLDKILRRRGTARPLIRRPCGATPSPARGGKEFSLHAYSAASTGRAGAARRSALSSSATRNATSIACSALSRGSQ